jgi:hypothetical protein
MLFRILVYYQYLNHRLNIKITNNGKSADCLKNRLINGARYEKRYPLDVISVALP